MHQRAVGQAENGRNSGDLHWNEIQERAEAHTRSVQFPCNTTYLRPESRGGRDEILFPDSQDFVDESFDFKSCENSVGITASRQRDDRYPHELFPVKPRMTGYLCQRRLSMAFGGGVGKYSGAGSRNPGSCVSAAEPYFRLGDTTLENGDGADCWRFYIRCEKNDPPYTRRGGRRLLRGMRFLMSGLSVVIAM